jgi:hypothetical protein
MPYLRWIKALSTSFVDLERLAHWMEMGTEPLHDRFTNVTLLEARGNAQPLRATITTARDLRRQLQSSRGPNLKLYIVEDLSQQVIEAFGGRFQTDPSFFAQHLDNYALSKNGKASGPTARLHYFHSRRVRNFFAYNRGRNWCTIANVRLRHHDTKGSFGRYEKGLRAMNVLRRCESDQYCASLDDAGVQVSTTLTQTTIWVGKEQGDHGAPIGIVLVDSTQDKGQPIWNNRPNWLSVPLGSSTLPPRVSGPAGNWYKDICDMSALYP